MLVEALPAPTATKVPPRAPSPKGAKGVRPPSPTQQGAKLHRKDSPKGSHRTQKAVPSGGGGSAGGGSKRTVALTAAGLPSTTIAGGDVEDEPSTSTATPSDTASESGSNAAPDAMEAVPPLKSSLKSTDLTRRLSALMSPSKRVVWGDLPRGEGAHSKWSEGGRRWIKAQFVQKARAKASKGGSADATRAAQNRSPTPRYAMSEIERAEEKLKAIQVRAERREAAAAAAAAAVAASAGAASERRAPSPTAAMRGANGGRARAGSQSDRAVGASPAKTITTARASFESLRRQAAAAEQKRLRAQTPPKRASPAAAAPAPATQDAAKKRETAASSKHEVAATSASAAGGAVGASSVGADAAAVAADEAGALRGLHVLSSLFPNPAAEGAMPAAAAAAKAKTVDSKPADAALALVDVSDSDAAVGGAPTEVENPGAAGGGKDVTATLNSSPQEREDPQALDASPNGEDASRSVVDRPASPTSFFDWMVGGVGVDSINSNGAGDDAASQEVRGESAPPFTSAAAIAPATEAVTANGGRRGSSPTGRVRGSATSQRRKTASPSARAASARAASPSARVAAKGRTSQRSNAR